jgi:hypothetical protein
MDPAGSRAARRGCRAVILALVILLTLAWEGDGRMDARQSSPFADREEPAPELCQVAPRPIAFFEHIAATPAAGPLATPGSTSDLPTTAGEPADEETITGIIATAREVTACINAGDQIRIDALYTDEYFFRQAAIGGPPSKQFIELLQSPATPLPATQRVAIYGVRDVEMLPDGRVRALIGFHFPPDDVAYLAIFVREGERWLIDQTAIVPWDTSISTAAGP